MNLRGWDSGIRWMKRRTVAPTDLPLTTAYVREHVLRTANDEYEDPKIERLIKAATEMAENKTQEALMPQTWQLRLTPGFPCSGLIVLPMPPLIEVPMIQYVDEDGDTQTLTGSPAQYEVTPSGNATKGTVSPLYGESWPSARYQPDAVVVTFRAGYDSADDIPERILEGMCLVIGELYKQRSLSVQNTIQNIPAVLQLDRFWSPRF